MLDLPLKLELMREVTGEEPKMWGPSIVGFGSYHYKYASGREGDAFLTGFSPRKQNLVVYILAGFEQYDELMAKLGKHTTGSSCLYIKRLADVEARERELSEGHAEFSFVGVVDVTATDLDQLDDACADVEQAAAQSLLDLRPLDARHDQGWVASLPLGRGLPRTVG